MIHLLALQDRGYEYKHNEASRGDATPWLKQTQYPKWPGKTWLPDDEAVREATGRGQARDREFLECGVKKSGKKSNIIHKIDRLKKSDSSAMIFYFSGIFFCERMLLFVCFLIYILQCI